MADPLPHLTIALSDRYRIERFLAEIRTTAALQHPHILPLFDSGAAASPPRSPPRSITRTGEA